MTLTQWIRTENAVQRYDFWLEMRGVARRRRKELRRELRSNLAEASADVGMTRALFGIGSPKELAHAATQNDPSRPLWARGALAATFVFGLVVFAMMYTATTFTAGVEAAEVTGETVRGAVFPWFGVEYSARVEPGHGGIAAGARNVQYYVLGLPLLAFLLVSQPWRLRRRRRRSAPVTAGRV
ncbi:hypothetical protein [Janibacter cremeus]|uniref:Uncharacterized protein n=1 Tax=Janibacter cremeus TaxID=1285192 RepID=A0A852VLP2_9MICO|nr:hypothetical protein [Janibacter cremeus]NYF96839.1 hypothetical protein [Janibacter cremeus]